MSINWKKILQQLGVKSKKELALSMGMNVEAFYKALQRKLPTTLEEKLLEKLSLTFNSLGDMLTWLDEVTFFSPYLSDEQKKEIVQPIFERKELLYTLKPPKYYVPRTEEERKLLTTILEGEHSANGGVFVTGMAGIGKTSLLKATLREAVRKHNFKERYDDVFWIDCDEKDVDEIVSLISVKSGVKIYGSIKFTHDHIREKLQNKSILLILDSLIEPEYLRTILSLIDRSKSKVIVSSRSRPDNAFLQEFEFGKFSLRKNFTIEQIQELHQKIIGEPLAEGDLDAVRYLRKETNGLPLPMVILCNLISMRGLSWDEAKEQYAHQKIGFLRSGTLLSKHNSVFVSFQLSFATLLKKHIRSAFLLVVFGFFEINKIPVRFLENFYANIFSETLENDLENLVRYGLIDIERLEGKRIIVLHLLTLQYAREQAQKYARILGNQWIYGYGRAYGNAVSSVLIDLHEEIMGGTINLQYALLICREGMHSIEFLNDARGYDLLITLAMEASESFKNLGLFDFEKRTLEILENIPVGNMDTEIEAVRNMTLGVLYYEHEKYDDAVIALEKALPNSLFRLKATIYRLLIKSFLEQGKVKKVKKYLDDALEFLDRHYNEIPDSEKPKFYASLMDVLLAYGDYENALIILDSILESCLFVKDELQIKIEKANIFLHIDKFDQSIELLNTIRPRVKQPLLEVQVIFLLFKAHFLNGDEEKARIYLHELLGRLEEFPVVWAKSYREEIASVLKKT